jgi:hypothetical protein
MLHPEFLPSPLEDRVGYFDHDRFRGYLAVHCCSGLQPPGLRFAMTVAGHHARLGSRLRARLCRGLHFRRLDYKSFQGTTPHRSVRARLRIRLLPRMNGVKALVRIRMQNMRVRNPPVQQWVETFPSHLRALTATD